MNRSIVGIIAGTSLFLSLCGFCSAQNAPAPLAATTPRQPSQNQPSEPSLAPANQRLAPGSVIPVQLTKTVDAKKVKPGDEVVAKVTQDLKSQNGQVIVPKDTQILGHVTEAQARTKEETESQLGIAFDHALMKGGGDVTLPMSIQAVIGQQNPDDSGAGESAGQPSASPSGGVSQSGARNGMGGGTSPVPGNPPPAETGSAGTSPQAPARPPITASTQGVVGLSNLKLSNASDRKQGSLLTSEKNNVKLESGTMMLLRVNQ